MCAHTNVPSSLDAPGLPITTPSIALQFPPHEGNSTDAAFYAAHIFQTHQGKQGLGGGTIFHLFPCHFRHRWREPVWNPKISPLVVRCWQRMCSFLVCATTVIALNCNNSSHTPSPLGARCEHFTKARGHCTAIISRQQQRAFGAN